VVGSLEGGDDGHNSAPWQERREAGGESLGWNSFHNGELESVENFGRQKGGKDPMLQAITWQIGRGKQNEITVS